MKIVIDTTEPLEKTIDKISTVLLESSYSPQYVAIRLGLSVSHIKRFKDEFGGLTFLQNSFYDKQIVNEIARERGK